MRRSEPRAIGLGVFKASRKALKKRFGTASLSSSALITITLDGYAASHRAVREMQNADMLPKSTKLRSSKYLNNLVEQDHRGIKSRTRPMLGFKNFNSAAITLAGVELASPYPQGTVRTQSTPTQRSGCAGDLERSPCCINFISLRPPHCNHFTYLHQSHI